MCTPTAPTGSSMWSLRSRPSTTTTTRIPETIPIIAAPRASTFVASRGDADKTGEAGVEAHRDIRLAVFDPCEEKCSDSGDRGGDSRGHENRSQLRAVCGSRAVESVPAEPEDERAESAERNVMTENRVNGDPSGLRILRVLSDTGTDHYSADQGGYAADRVNRRGTRDNQ